MATLRNVTIGNNVRNITSGAFANSPITSLGLGESVQVINQTAFSSNNLTELFIPNSVQDLSGGSFNYSNNLTTLVVGDDSYTGEPQLVLNGMFGSTAAPNLASVTLGNTVHSVINNSFSIPALTNLDLGSAIRVISGSSFVGTSITDLFIPDSVEQFGNGSFSNSAHLVNITFGTPDYTGPAKITFGSGAFSGSLPVLETVRVLNNVHTIRDGVISGVSSLEYVEIGRGVETIQFGSFGNNSNLHTVIIGDDTKIISIGAFQQLPSLTNLKLGSSLETISDGAFSMNKLHSAQLPASLVTVSGGAFGSSTELQKLTIEGDTAIINSAFAYDPSKLTEVLINGDAIFDETIEEAFVATVTNTGEYIRVYAPRTSSWYDAPDLEGIYVVNPAEINLRYVDVNDNDLATAYYALSDEVDDYTVAANPEADFSVYYRAGDEIALNPVHGSGCWLYYT